MYHSKQYTTLNRNIIQMSMQIFHYILHPQNVSDLYFIAPMLKVKTVSTTEDGDLGQKGLTAKGAQNDREVITRESELAGK